MKEKLGELLIQKGWLSKEQLTGALDIQKQDPAHKPIGIILVENGFISEEQLTQALAEQYQMPFVRLDDVTLDAKITAHISPKVAWHYQMMPLSLDDSTLTVAISDPRDVRLLDELRLALKQRYLIEPVLATSEDIIRALKKHYGVGSDAMEGPLTEPQVEPSAALSNAEDALEDIKGQANESSVVNLVNQILLEAHHRRATDVHLEPSRGKVRLRYRIDGMLQNVEVLPAFRGLFPAIVSRVKVISNLNIVERRLPQDGRASVKIAEEKLDLRVSVLPVPSGESIVIRILPDRMLLDLEELGFRAEDIGIIDEMIHRPHGLIFVTGPTGSGKTTTLYACLKRINTEQRKIITVEDPVEYELEGVTQVQVHPSIGLSFAQGLRSMLRHDPNVMMVGEVRDLETAELAIRIALTGHLVLSTLHTSDAVGGIVRLMDMGIEPFLIASSIECIIAQRLVRLLCPDCKAHGCKACQQSGFHGRKAIYEILRIQEPIRELILKKTSAESLRQAAIRQGMRLMEEEGEEKVKAGLTTMEEVKRVTYHEP